MALSKALHSDNFSCTVSEYGFEGRGVVSSGADGITGHGFEVVEFGGIMAKPSVGRNLPRVSIHLLKKDFSDV